MALALGTNAGFVETAPTADPAAAETTQIDDRASAVKHTAPAGFTNISELGVYIQNATEAGNIQFAIYDHDVGNDRPKDVVGSIYTVAKGTTLGWKTVAVDIDVTAGTIYWVSAVVTDTATTTLIDYASAGGQDFALDLNQPTLTDPWVGVNENADAMGTIYALKTPPAPPAPTRAIQGTKSTRSIRTKYPITSGIGADDKHDGRQINLVPETSNVPKRIQVGLYE